MELKWVRSIVMACISCPSKCLLDCKIFGSAKIKGASFVYDFSLSLFGTKSDGKVLVSCMIKYM